MKAVLAATVLASMLSSQAFAGAANAQIKCKSADGKIQLEGDVPGDFADFSITAEINDKNGPMTVKLYAELNQTSGQYEENGRISVIEDLRNGVYTLNAEAKDETQTIRLYALPKTVKYREHMAGHSSSFTGKLTVLTQNQLSNSTVTCTTNYSI